MNSPLKICDRVTKEIKLIHFVYKSEITIINFEISKVYNKSME